MLEHAASALFLDPGLGKTSITLAAIKILKHKKLLSKVLLIAPLRVCYNVWPEEIMKWTDFNDLKIAVLHGPKKDDALKSKADIYIINPEGLDWLLQTQKTKTTQGKTRVNIDLRYFTNLGFDTLVIDELSAFKHINTNRFKSMKLVLGTFRRRWGLTGSPAANGLLDLFGQCFMLDQGRTLGPYISHFRMEYFVPNYNGFGWTIREGAENKIYERINPLVLRMAADDYLDMPTLIENNIYVDLPDNVMSVYNQLEKDLVAKINSKIIVASTAAAASMKCRQVANGGIYLDHDVQALIKLPKSNREWVNLHTEKVDALADLINELQGNPLLVAYDFIHDLDRLRIKFGHDIPYIGGGVSATHSAKLEKLWNAGKLPVLFGHPQAIAHGLNLQEVGYHVCWHSLTWNYELYDQFIHRIRRQGSKSKKVFCHHIIARGTIDEIMLTIVKLKRHGQNALFDALKKLNG